MTMETPFGDANGKDMLGCAALILAAALGLALVIWVERTTQVATPTPEEPRDGNV